MIEITINEFTNGFSLAVYDNKDGFIVREIHEEKIEALKTLRLVVTELITKEREVILNQAMDVV